MKLVVEVVAFCMRNGLPGDNLGDFVKALTHYRDEARIRMAALICVDGLLPLGPDFLSKVLGALGAGGAAGLQQNETFQRVHSLIPGGGAEGQLGFIQKGMQSAKDWMADFTAKNDLTPAKVLGGLQGFIDSAGAKLDYVAAFLDLTTDYYRHTGIQSVARSVIETLGGQRGARRRRRSAAVLGLAAIGIDDPRGQKVEFRPPDRPPRDLL